MSSPLRIGTKIKHARKVRNLRLRQLAEAVGCSESMLSKVENDKINPSLQMLHRIVTELGISIAELTAETPDDATIVMRQGNRPVIDTSHTREGTGTSLEWLMPQANASLLEASIHSVEPGEGSSGTITHDGEEMGYVLEGTLELEVDGEKHIVNAGDSFFFASVRPHGYKNPGDVPVRVLWVTTPPTF